jgi:TrmH family RNA methyltransferase
MKDHERVDIHQGMITSLANERIKAIRKLQERKARQETGLFYIEGLRIVAEAIEQQAQIDTLVTAPDLLKSAFGQQLVAEQRAAGTSILEVSAEVFARLSLKEGPQGVAAVVRQTWARLNDVMPSADGKTATWVALEAVADPGNLGTILRTLDAVGGQGVILLDQTTDPYDPSAMRASMGALFTQKLIRASYEEFAAWKRSTAYPVVGTSDKASVDYHHYAFPDSVILLMGSERQGLSQPYMALCDQMVSMPMLGKCDSLNLGVATAVVLYEILNQRRDRA